ncbi:MAG: hypothetical protein U9R53_03015 [Chloroflexota bacterium]|nr:hypothetical protein [Chloroflexota bacterium]
MTLQNKLKTQETDQAHNTLPIGDESSEMGLAYPKTRIRIGLGLTVIGYLLFLLGARPSLFGLDRSRVIGFVQISVFLIGLALITVGSYLTLNALWPESKKTIAADIGSRLVSTGYVVCVFTGMADIFGLGSHPLPNVFFGPLQARGMAIGMATIAVGFMLLIRYNLSENNHTNSLFNKGGKKPKDHAGSS